LALFTRLYRDERSTKQKNHLLAELQLNFSSKRYKTQIKKALYKDDSQPVVCIEGSAM